jgi:glycosyltransferase involved in cell wall biosynthesis
MDEPKLCWVLTNLVPYHHVRLRALAARAACTPCAVTLTDQDRFPILEHRPPEGLDYRHVNLFDRVPLSAIPTHVFVRRLWTALDAMQPDVVCVNGWSFGGCHATLAWAAMRRRPAVMMSDSTFADAPRSRWKEAIKRRVVRLASAALVAGRPHADYIHALGLSRERIFTGYDVVDNEHFRAGAAAARDLPPGTAHRRLRLPERYFIAVARFEYKKNLERLILGYARYCERTPEPRWSLVILGEGALRPALEKMRGMLDLDDRILLPGSVPYQLLPAYYGLAGAFVHASTTEQWGLVVNEAMAAGLPVVVSRRCGCAVDLVQPGYNGFLFDPFDVDELAQRLIEVAADPAWREAMGRESLKVIAEWSPERFADGLLQAARVALALPPPRLGLGEHLLLTFLQRQARWR